MFDALKPPRRFGSGTVEAAFLEEFRSSGLRLAKIAFFVAALMTLTFWAVLAIFPTEAQISLPRQFARLGLVIVLLVAGCYLQIRSTKAIASFRLSVGVPMAVGCLIVGSMGLVPLDTGEPAINRFVVAMTLTCWLCYGFTRLPTVLVAGACIPASVLTLVGVALQGDDHALALGIYLAVANLIGWILSIEVERRERAVFWSSRQLRQTTRDLEEMARKANELDEAKTRVLAAVSHDLRQPLASLTLYAQLLREGGASTNGATFLSTVESVDACIGALSSDLDRLSELGLRERGTPLPVASVDLRSVLERIERVYSGQAIRCGVRLRVRAPKSGAYVVTSNESRLWDIFANLVGNALKFSVPERAAWVLVRARQRQGGVEVIVRDNGIGIGPADQRRVFDEYFQVSNPARSPKLGQGLGLSIVRETVSRLPSHSIRLFSVPDRGTQFIVRMPGERTLAVRVSEAPREPTRVMTTYPPTGDLPAGRLADCVSESTGVRYRGSGPHSGQRERARLADRSKAKSDRAAADDVFVLVVEDDESMRDALGRMFERWGFVVEVAASGEDAVSMTVSSQRSFDAIVSDFRLPGAWDGLRLIDELRRLEGRRTPAILLSGEFRVEALRCDAPSDVHVMGKPPDVGLLRELLTGFVRGDDPVGMHLNA